MAFLKSGFLLDSVLDGYAWLTKDLPDTDLGDPRVWGLVYSCRSLLDEFMTIKREKRVSPILPGLPSGEEMVAAGGPIDSRGEALLAEHSSLYSLNTRSVLQSRGCPR